MSMKKVRRPVRSDDANAFLRTGDEDGATKTTDDLAEYMGETFVREALSGEDSEEAWQEEVASEEVGGPFSETSEAEEFGETRLEGEGGPSTGETPDGEKEEVLREPFPRAIHGLRRVVRA